MRRSTSAVRRACAVGTTVALIGLTTGLGMMTATSASAATGDETAAVQPSGTTTNGTGTPGTDGSAAGTGATDAGAGDAGDAAGAGESGTGAETGTPADGDTAGAAGGSADGTQDSGSDADGQQPVDDDPAAGTTAPPASTSPVAPPTSGTLAASTATVTISGTAAVGQTLTAEPNGFASPRNLEYSWTSAGTELSQAATYKVKDSDAGKVLRITVTDTTASPAESQYAETAPVTQAVQFVDADGTPITDGTDEQSDLVIDATAGERFSYTFRATGYPKPTLALAWYYTDDEDYPSSLTPASQLPEDVSFDPKTGVLTGSTEDARDYEFAVTASNGTTTLTQTVDLDVSAAAPVGLEAYAVDRETFLDFVKSGLSIGVGDDEAHSGELTSWIIGADGAVSTMHADYESDGDGGSSLEETTPGGTVTVPQGGTLLLSGSPVDRFGNVVEDEDAFGLPDIDVTSNVATDVIKADPVLGDVGFVGVTFPHASTHRLTVSASEFSTAFDVDVVPTAVPATPTVTTPTVSAPIGTVQHGTIPAAQHGRLAYTGADETAPLAWALGLLVAGAGLIGARALRRRHGSR